LATQQSLLSFSEVNQPHSETDLDLYRENLRRELAILIERMDSHAIALATLASGTDPTGKKEPDIDEVALHPPVPAP
jgi:hypothetical protein